MHQYCVISIAHPISMTFIGSDLPTLKKFYEYMCTWTCGGKAISLIAVMKSLWFQILFLRQFRCHGTQAYSSNRFGEMLQLPYCNTRTTSMNSNFDECLTMPSGKLVILILPLQCCLHWQWQQTAEEGSVIQPFWLAWSNELNAQSIWIGEAGGGEC